MTFLGHGEVVGLLERGLPPVALLLGPPSVGKWTLTHHLADHHAFAQVDRFTAPDGLRVDTVRTIRRFVSSRPFGALKLVQIRLDGSTEPALNALLKTLEEPPATVRFLLTCSTRTLPTITSRAQVFRLGLLSAEELRDILIAEGMSKPVATRAAALGRGQVKTALTVDTSDDAKSNVLTVMRAVSSGDRDLFERAFRFFDDNSRDLLLCWLREAITGQWAIFTEDDSFGMRREPARLRKMLLAVSQLSRARSRLGVRAALEPFL